MLTLYGLKNCDSCRKLKKTLEAAGHEVDLHDFRSEGLDRDLLDHFLQFFTWDSLLNTRSTTWRQLPESQKTDLHQEHAMALMLAHPALIKRPLLKTPDGSLRLGKDAQAFRGHES